jgi:hypothetical protein
MNKLEQHFDAKEYIGFDIKEADGETWKEAPIDLDSWDSMSAAERKQHLWDNIDSKCAVRLYKFWLTIHREDGWHKHLTEDEICELSISDFTAHGLLERIWEVQGFENFYDWWFCEGFDDDEHNVSVAELLQDADVRRDLEAEAIIRIVKAHSADHKKSLTQKLQEMLSIKV